MASNPNIRFGDIPLQARSWRNTETIQQWCRQYTFIDEASHSRWLERVSADPTIKMFGIYHFGHPVGVCGLTSIDRVNQNAEFSLYISPSEQRQGLGKAALRELLRHGFQDHNLERIWGESFEGNPAIEMFKSLGMKEEGRLRRAYFRRGKFVDAIRVSMLREEFTC